MHIVIETLCTGDIDGETDKKGKGPLWPTFVETHVFNWKCGEGAKRACSSMYRA